MTLMALRVSKQTETALDRLTGPNLAIQCMVAGFARARLTVMFGCLGAIVMMIAMAVAVPSAWAIDAIKITGDEERIEITPRGVIMNGQGDNLRVNTASGLDGVVRQMSVKAATGGTNPSWIVFALRNVSDKPLVRWITAQRYHLIGSRIMWPDLDARRIQALTPSVGFLPQRVPNERADVFRITIEPGQTVTYIAELASERARIYLWQPHSYELQALDRQLFRGIMLGIAGVLGVFLTSIFAANHKVIFPSAALVAWCVLAYLCVDFGFWHKLLQLRAEDNAVYRAATESAIAASLVIFLHTFLRLGSWHGFFRMLSWVWIIAQLALVFVAILDPRLASTFARLSFVAIGALGGLLTLFLAVRGQDRALSLIPTWILFLVWIFGAAVTLTGQLSGEIVVSGLVGGLTLIVVLIGFTVMQFAFGSAPVHVSATPSEQGLRSLAVDGAGAAVWEWHARRGEVKVSPIIEESLGLNHGELSTKTDAFLKHLHSGDQERFRVLLRSVEERSEGMLRTNFRIRHADNSYRWFDLEASIVPSADSRALRCVGLLRDVTDQKRAHARLLHDAVHDSLTGLPNRELFLDRLQVANESSRRGSGRRPAVVFIDLNKFKAANASFGLLVGDSLLLTVARRLSRHLRSQDTLARVGGDQFAILLPDGYGSNSGKPELTEAGAGAFNPPQHQVAQLMAFGEEICRSLRTPIRIAGQDVVLTGRLGIAPYDGQESDDNSLLKDAEIAMYQAKRTGAGEVALFRADMRRAYDDRAEIEGELSKALEKRQIKVLFQPIIYLPTEELAGFEASVRWDHPRLGPLNPSEYISTTEDNDLIVQLGSDMLSQAVEQAALWQEELPRVDNPLFVSINVSSRQLFRQDLIQEIRHIVGKSIVPDGVLRLEVNESLVMENPERATEILESLKLAGARLILDDFGTGYSSLAYLQRFPFETIKIDHDLVEASAEDSSCAAIVRSIVALAHELGKKAIAAGVESSEDVGVLRSIGCEYAQGFYYGEPMSSRGVLDLIRIISKSERKLHRRGFFRTKPSGSGVVKMPPRANGSKRQPVVDEQVGRARRSDVANGNRSGNGVEGGSESMQPRPRTDSEASQLTPQLGASALRTRPRQARPQENAAHVSAAGDRQARGRPASGKSALEQQRHAQSRSQKTPEQGLQDWSARQVSAPTPHASSGERTPPPIQSTKMPPPSSRPPTPRQPPSTVRQTPVQRALGGSQPPSVSERTPNLQERLQEGEVVSSEAGRDPQVPTSETKTASQQARRQEPSLPDLTALPPGIASSLAKLAGVSYEPGDVTEEALPDSGDGRKTEVKSARDARNVLRRGASSATKVTSRN